LAPNDGIEIKATGSVHLSLQGKGGVGKSPVASILAQHLNRKALAVRCIDWDQAHDKGLRTAPLPLLREGGIDQRAFDGLMEELLTTDGVFVVDNGASTLIPSGTTSCRTSFTRCSAPRARDSSCTRS
jgi:adenylylsulfate kinase-like enzyme